jgi:hypothetical protein
MEHPPVQPNSHSSPGAAWTKSSTTSLTIIFVTTLVLGLLGNEAFRRNRAEGFILDEEKYFSLAEQLCSTGTFGDPDASTAPGYPLYLSTLFAVFEPSRSVGETGQVFLNAVISVLAFQIASNLYNRTTGFVSVFLMLLNSFWWFTNSRLMTEPLQAVLVGYSFLLLVPKKTGPIGKGRALISGSMFGLSQLVKPTMLPFIPISILCIGVAPAAFRSTYAHALVLFVVGAFATWCPWWVRNFYVFGTFVPFTTASGQVFYGSHWSGNPFRGEWLTPPPLASDDACSEVNSGLSALQKSRNRELSTDKDKWRRGFEEICRRSWKEIGRHEVYKVLRFWSPSVFFGRTSALTSIAKVAWIVVNCVILLGFFVSSLQRTRENLLAWALLSSALITTLVFWGTIRFRYPFSAVISVFAAHFVVTTWYRLRRGAITECS